jgi:hypothetical protein
LRIDAFGLPESGMKAYEGAPSAINYCYSVSYKEMKATILFTCQFLANLLSPLKNCKVLFAVFYYFIIFANKSQN